MATIEPTKTSPFREKFNFDWFSFDNKSSSGEKDTGSRASPKSPVFSPASPELPHKPNSLLSPPPTAPSAASFFSDSSSSSSISPSTPLSLFSTSPLPSRRFPHPSHLPLPPTPEKALAWTWTCHLCRSRYTLGVTRRCLVDGHYYCSGDNGASATANQKNVKRRKKGQSCTSEFDYIRWAEWGTWKRKAAVLKAYSKIYANGKPVTGETVIIQGCTGCDFPSQCRYHNKAPEEKLEITKVLEDFVASLDEQGVRLFDEIEEAISPEKAAFEEVLEEKGRARRQSEQLVIGRSRNNALKIDPIRANKLAQGGRFYSNLGPRSSSFEFSPTDTNMSEADDLAAVEATLKAALSAERGHAESSGPLRKTQSQSRLTDFFRQATKSGSSRGQKLGATMGALESRGTNGQMSMDNFEDIKLSPDQEGAERDESGGVQFVFPVLSPGSRKL